MSHSSDADDCYEFAGHFQEDRKAPGSCEVAFKAARESTVLVRFRTKMER